MNEMFNMLIKEVKKILKLDVSNDKKLQLVCNLLRNSVPHYNWVGFYLVDKNKPEELVLATFDGEPTEHVRILFGRGICGQAAEQKKTFIVQDVIRENNYLACSARVKSEIVVPIFRNKKLVGEIDVDSHKLAPFTENDKIFLEKIAEIIAEVIEKRHRRL
ncbi:MAG: GAF domain-containing protein [Thermoplasmata archaeon]|nr:MAG: GAF domain-containing protein [Thermoplasmata archaeon]